MHALLEAAPSLEALTAAAHKTWGEIAPHVANACHEILISREQDALLLASTTGSVLVLQEGSLVASRNSCALITYEEGDLVGHSEISNNSGLVATSSFAVKATQVPLPVLWKTLSSNPELISAWTKLLAHHEEAWRCVAEQCAQRLSLGDQTSPPSVQHFEQGEIIIDQGGTTDEVFTLVEGRAEAFVDGVKVGEIQSDEIFGAIAAIAGVPRTASVVAATRCMALTIPKGDFLHLLKSRPSTVLRLIQDMARALSSTNDRVVGKLR